MDILTFQTVQVDSNPIKQLIKQEIQKAIEPLNKRNEDLEKRINNDKDIRI